VPGVGNTPLVAFESNIAGQFWALWSGAVNQSPQIANGSNWVTNDDALQYEGAELGMINYVPGTDTLQFTFTFNCPAGITNEQAELWFFFTDASGNGVRVSFAVFTTGAPYYRLAVRDSDAGSPWGNAGPPIVNFADGSAALTPADGLTVSGTLAPNGDIDVQFTSPNSGENIASFNTPGTSFGHTPAAANYNLFSMVIGRNGVLGTGFFRVTDVMVNVV